MEHFVFQGLAATIGVLLLYLSFFLSTDREGKPRDRIEDLWSSIEDAWAKGGNRSVIFLRMVAQTANSILNGLLGPELISYRSFGVSSSFALFGFWMAASMLLENHDRRIIAVQILLGVMALLCGAAPLLSKRGSMTAITLCPCLATPAIALGFSRVPLLQSTFIAAGLIVGMLAGFFLIVLQRLRIRRMCEARGFGTIVPILLLQLLLPILLFSVPFIVDAYLGSDSVTVTVEILTYLNFSNELILLAFFVVLTMVILHKLLWPVLGRFVYASAKYRIVHQPALMAVLGLAFLFAAFRHGWIFKLR
jgi:hypothetical protein